MTCGGAELRYSKCPAAQAARAGGEHNRAGLGDRLQARREVGCVTDDCLSLRSSFRDEVADHDDTGGDADTGLERLVGGSFEPRDCGDDVESSPHRPLGIILVGMRKTEINQ